ncbi:hypothetical protein [Paenibacillus sp.]|uniref:hypothetical protein n=1 Tax=Paenibacillus sp. TaxID=58172 RepID=UPI002D2A170B|nr:hypothetical protein [Paenibacillus sp.]HZG55912.1 hypothetical protein [Paenibacillus sp.]
MDRNAQTVPYGFRAKENGAQAARGTLIYYDAFAQEDEAALGEALDQAAALARRRTFAKLVLYPLHEETIKRMQGRGSSVAPYYKREERLFEWRHERGEGLATVETWEGKRKKYTPMEAALRHLADTYAAPLFLLLSPDNANAFASYASFDEWIAKLRLVLTEPPASIHPKLERHRSRWDVADAEEE